MKLFLYYWLGAAPAVWLLYAGEISALQAFLLSTAISAVAGLIEGFAMAAIADFKGKYKG